MATIKEQIEKIVEQLKAIDRPEWLVSADAHYHARCDEVQIYPQQFREAFPGVTPVDHDERWVRLETTVNGVRVLCLEAK